MSYIGDFAEDYATLNTKFTTVNGSGVPTTLAGTPAISVYKANGTTESTAGITLTADFDSRTGLNNVLIDLSADAFYATGNDYQIVITTGTVDSKSVVGYVVGEFSIENRFMRGTDSAALASTLSTKVPNNLNTTASGNIGIDWANVENATTAVDLSGTDIQLADTVTDVTNAVTGNMTQISGSTTAADNLERGAVALVLGEAIAGTLSTTEMTTDLTEATDDHYNGRVITWTSGVLAGQSTDITDYTGSSKKLTYTATTEAPSATDEFVIS